jgi:hypothetical protein
VLASESQESYDDIQSPNAGGTIPTSDSGSCGSSREP